MASIGVALKIVFMVVLSLLIIAPFYYLAKLVKWQLKQRKV
jgi:hypothetical protein